MSDTLQFGEGDGLDTDLDVEFAAHGGADGGWREAHILGRVGGYLFAASGTGSRDERALAEALEDLAQQLRVVFPRVYMK